MMIDVQDLCCLEPATVWRKDSKERFSDLWRVVPGRGSSLFPAEGM